MNQILITEKIYVTPELKRKKKIYKFLFLISIFLILTLCSIYIYAECARNKSEEISKKLLEDFISNDNTIISSEQNALIVKLTQENIQDENEEEQQQVNLNLATATEKYETASGTYDIIGRITIPKIGVDYPIFSETTDQLLKISICKFHGGNPNEVGNLCLAGHNYRNNKFFSKVDTLVIGDIIEITDLSKRKIQYEIYDIHTVDPSDRRDTTQLTNGKKEVTLITCTDDTKQRIIVKCTEKI